MASGTAEQDDQGAPRAAPDFDPLALAKALLRSVGSGALATLDPQGAPFSSLTTVATDMDGRPLLLLSRLAAHTAHLEADGRASLGEKARGATPAPLVLARIAQSIFHAEKITLGTAGSPAGFL